MNTVRRTITIYDQMLKDKVGNKASQVKQEFTRVQIKLTVRMYMCHLLHLTKNRYFCVKG